MKTAILVSLCALLFGVQARAEETQQAPSSTTDWTPTAADKAFIQAHLQDTVDLRDDEVFRTAVSPVIGKFRESRIIPGTVLDQRALRAAIVKLAFSQREEAVPVIAPLLLGKSTSVQSMAIYGLQMTCQPSAVDPLADALKRYEAELPPPLDKKTLKQAQIQGLYLNAFTALAFLNTKESVAAINTSLEHARSRYAGSPEGSPLIHLLEETRDSHAKNSVHYTVETLRAEASAQVAKYLDYAIPPEATTKIGPHFQPPNLTGINYLIPANKYTHRREPELVGRESFDHGVLVSRELYLHDKKHGVQREWYPNGLLKSEEPYRNGVMHGVFKKWSEHGALIGQSTFVEGRGKLEVYDEEGVFTDERNYKGNRKNGLFVSRLNIPGSPDHRMTLMWIKDGRRVGIAYDFYEDGTLSRLNFAVGGSGNVFGPSVDFDKGGIASVKWYRDGKEVPEAKYAQAAALDPKLPPYYHEPDKYREFVSPEVRALVKHYQEMPRVKIPLEFGPDGKPILARQP